MKVVTMSTNILNGRDEETRTLKVLRPRDFKSLVYTIPPHPDNNILTKKIKVVKEKNTYF